MIVTITTRLTNSQESNKHPLREGLQGRMIRMARNDEYISQLGASEAIINASSRKKGGRFNKDGTHPKMKRRFKSPRILLLDCNLKYNKEDDCSKSFEWEEAHVKKSCDEITTFKRDLVITEKGESDLAQRFSSKAGVTAVRRQTKGVQCQRTPLSPYAEDC